MAGGFDLGTAAANDRFAFLVPESAAAAFDLAPEERSAIEVPG